LIRPIDEVRRLPLLEKKGLALRLSIGKRSTLLGLQLISSEIEVSEGSEKYTTQVPGRLLVWGGGLTVRIQKEKSILVIQQRDTKRGENEL